MMVKYWCAIGCVVIQALKLLIPYFIVEKEDGEYTPWVAKTKVKDDDSLNDPSFKNLIDKIKDLDSSLEEKDVIDQLWDLFKKWTF